MFRENASCHCDTYNATRLPAEANLKLTSLMATRQLRSLCPYGIAQQHNSKVPD